MGRRGIAGAACLAAIAVTGAWGADEAPDTKRLADEARKVATEFVAQIRGALTKEIELSGPLRAVIVCKYTVGEMSSAASRRTGWRVTRVSLRPRNPALGAADEWEQAALRDFERRADRGERADAMEFTEIVEEPSGRFHRYVRALPATGACLSCHGSDDRIPPMVKSLIKSEYPHDRATGYAQGQVLGAVSIKRPL